MPFFEQRIGGVCAATVTPLNERFEPDHTALIAHCRRLLATGCDAINLLGTTGEATSLSVAARVGVMRALAESDVGVGRFIVGTGAAAFADAVTLTRAAGELGYRGALVIPPFYFKNLTDVGVTRFYSRLIDASGGEAARIYLYNYPQLTGFTFSPELVAQLTRAYPTTIVGIKDSSGVPGYPESIVAACPELDVFPSSEALLAGGKASGFAGCISATANLTAPLAARVWHHGGSESGALAALRAILARHQLVPALRAVLAAFSGDAAWLRVLPPLIELTAADATALIAELDTVSEFAAIREVYACA